MASTKKPDVLIFDVNGTLLDMSPLQGSVSKLLNQPDAYQLWFEELLHYSLAMTVSQQFSPFTEIAKATLKMLAKQYGMQASDDEIVNALSAMSSLHAFPEVAKALAGLKEKNYRLAALSNSSQTSLDSQLTHAGLSVHFEKQLSVDGVHKYKPHRDVYLWAAESMGVKIQDCMLVAAHGWDVAGAKWAGMQTAFIRRPRQQLFPLAPEPDLDLHDLSALLKNL